MSLGLLLLIVFAVILTIGGVVVLGPAMLTYASKSGDRRELAASQAREKYATRALRAIANGAGNPVLEATDALDKIENTYTNNYKELR